MYPCPLQRLPAAICAAGIALRRRLLAATRPATAQPTGTLANLVRRMPELIVEHALLRQQLVILRRSAKRQCCTTADQMLLALLVNRTWGAERIRGELLKLDIQVAKWTIQKYTRSACPPRRSGHTWAAFLRNHVHEICACDFLPGIDMLFRPLNAFFVIELASRRVVHVGVTRHPRDAWVAQQLREATPFGRHPKHLIRDNDAKCGPTFAALASATGIEDVHTAYRAPKENAIRERFLGSVRRECLDHLFVLGEAHLRRILRENVAYFNPAGPHQGLQQRIPHPLEACSPSWGQYAPHLSLAVSIIPTAERPKGPRTH